MIDPKYKRRQRVAYEPCISLGPIVQRRVGTVRNDPEFCAGCWRYSIDFDNGEHGVFLEEFYIAGAS